MSAADEAWLDWRDVRNPFDGDPDEASFMAGYRRALEDAADAIDDEWPGGTGNEGLVVMWAEDWLRARAAAVVDPHERKG